jgi:hypothetical protein
VGVDSFKLQFASSTSCSSVTSWSDVGDTASTTALWRGYNNAGLTDGATLCSNADKNPTLTIMALAWRASDHMLGLMKRKEL